MAIVVGIPGKRSKWVNGYVWIFPADPFKGFDEEGNVFNRRNLCHKGLRVS